MLAPEFLPAWGGVGTYIVELVRHLSNDVEFHVVAPKREGFNQDKLSTLEYDLAEYFGSSVHVHFVCMVSDTFMYNARFQYACLRHVPKLVKEENIDLIHSHTAHMPDLLLMLRRLETPLVTTIHTTIKYQRLSTIASRRGFKDLEASEKGTLVLYPFLRLFEELYFRQRRSYITPSNWMKRWMEQNAPIDGGVRVIPHSIDLKKIKQMNGEGAFDELIPREVRGRRIVLYVGRLLSMKGVDVLIESISKSLEVYKADDLLFVFVGPGDRGKYIERIKVLGIDRCCVFTGPLPRRRVIQLIWCSEILVVPSFLENTPYVILEAMACGVPVIATDVGGIPEMIDNGRNGVLVNPGSSEELVTGMLRVLEDDSFRTRLSHNAERTVSSRYSWTVNAENYLQAYKDCIARKPFSSSA